MRLAVSCQSAAAAHPERERTMLEWEGVAPACLSTRRFSRALSSLRCQVAWELANHGARRVRKKWRRRVAVVVIGARRRAACCVRSRHRAVRVFGIAPAGRVVTDSRTTTLQMTMTHCASGAPRAAAAAASCR